MADNFSIFSLQMPSNIVSLFKRFGRRVFQNQTIQTAKTLVAIGLENNSTHYILKNIKLIVLFYLLTQNLCGQINIINSSQTDTTIYLTADIEPKFPGDTLLKFLYHNIKYPPITRCEASGTIIVEFIIEKNGKITYPKILKSFHSTYDNEVLRVINIMPNWTAGYTNDIAVRTKRIIPIIIHLR